MWYGEYYGGSNMASLMNVIQKKLRFLASLQTKHTFLFAIIITLFTLITLYGAFSITLQSDLSELDPQDIPVTQLRNKINTEFNQFESVVVLIELDDTLDSGRHDIRDPDVMAFVTRLDKKFREEISIQEVTSIAELF